MSEFIARLSYDGKNYMNQVIHIPAGTEVLEKNGRLYYEGIPFCGQTSQVARDYFIWNGDGNCQMRLIYENGILFDTRIKIWEADAPIFNDLGEVIGYEKVQRTGRFTPTECNYIRAHFPNLLENDSFLFNNYFYIGSNITEIKALYEYIKRS